MSVPMRWQEPVEPQEAIQPVARPQRRKATRRSYRARRVALIVATVAICASAALGMRLEGWPKVPDNALHMVQPSGQGVQVLLCGTFVDRNLGFVTVTGSVKNRTKQRLGHVEAVVELKDVQNNTLAVESALLPLDPLRAGETAPFRVEMQDHPHAVSYLVHFRRLLGASLD